MFFILLTSGLGLGLGQSMRHFGFTTILPSVLWLTFSSLRATSDLLSLPCRAVISNYYWPPSEKRAKNIPFQENLGLGHHQMHQIGPFLNSHSFPYSIQFPRLDRF